MCDNIQLNAKLLSQCIYPIQYKWDITFSNVGTGFTSSQQQDALDYFKTFSTYSSIAALNIPSNYFTKDSVLNVKLSAQTASGLGVTTTSTQVTVMGNLPSIRFTERSQGITEFSSDSPTIIAFDVINKKCAESSRLLQSSSVLPITVDFQLFSGSSSSAITDRGATEMQIEQGFYSLYSKYQTITANFTQGFKYNMFYKLVITVTLTTSNTKVSDSLTFSFTKSPITAVIDSLGGIATVISDLTLNGRNSTIPQPEGDTIDYTWKCESAISFLNGSTCTCPILLSNFLKSDQLTIANAKIQNLCKYSYSLSVMATSSAGNKRTSSTKTEFLAYKSAILPIYGKVVQGHMFNVRDIYFSTQITSSCPDSQLSFEWSLVEVESLLPSSGVKYSQKNTFILNYLKKTGLALNSSLAKDDKEIPQSYQPDYLTSLSDRILGCDAKKMTEKTKYTYGVTVSYPSNASFVFITYETQLQPRNRTLKITPQSGFGMETSFSLAFSLLKTTEVDRAQYQILRRDCPSSTSEAIPVTQVLGTRNSYTGVFSPGQESCKYQVEIVVRAIEYGSSIEVGNIITIKPSNKTANDVVADSLNQLKANSNNTNPNQKLTMLGQISNVKVTDSSKGGKDAVNTIKDGITDLDKPSGGVRDIMTKDQAIPLLNATSSTMGNLLNTQSSNVDPTLASNVTAKVSNYLNDTGSLSGGTQIFPSFLSTLSSVAKIGTSAGSDNAFFKDIHNVLTNLITLKLKDAMPGAVPFSISSNKMELLIQNSYVSAFNNPQTLSTSKGASIGLPGNMANTFLNAITDSAIKASNPVTIATSLLGQSFNPYLDTKASSVLSVSSINNQSSSFVPAETIALIYKDMAAGKLSDVVDSKKLSADIVEVGFMPMYIDKSGNNKNLGSGIEIGKLPDNGKANWIIPTQIDPNNSIVVPMYFIEDTGAWINNGCGITSTNSTNKVSASCDNLGKQETKKALKIDASTAIKMTTDIIKDVLNVLKAGNYMMLYNFGAFTNASWGGYLVLSCIVVFLIFIGYLTWFLNKSDNWVLLEERIITLEERYGESRKEISGGVMMKVFTFYSQVRKKGMNKVAKDSGQGNTVALNTNEPKEIKIPNGFSVLTPYEEKKLKRIYDFIAEHSTRFPNQFFFLNYYNEICSNAILRRLTQARFNDDIISRPVTFWRILKVKEYF